MASGGGGATLALAVASTTAAAAMVRALLHRGYRNAPEWEVVTKHLRVTLATKGLDIVAPLRLQWYNDIAPESAKIAPGGGGAAGSSLVVLVGNSRELWPRFCDAHDADRAIADAKDPLDTYVAREVESAVRAAPAPAPAPDSSPAPALHRHRVFYAHETKPGRLVAIQRMAHVAGVAHLDERCHLSIHPELGPWLALRVVVVFDDVPGPPDDAKPSPPGNPLALDAAARERVDAAFDAALAGYERPEGVDDAAQWRRWVDVRDAVEPRHSRRYHDDQVLYHYDADARGGSRGGGGGEGGEGGVGDGAMSERARIRSGLRGFERKK